MKIISRILEEEIIKSLSPGKVIAIFGARRTGKTVLINKIRASINEPVLFIHGEDLQMTASLSYRSINTYKNILGDRRVLIIDEAQKIENIGEILKLMIDGLEGLKILVTGSSAFDMSRKIGEPLTGRKISFQLFPVSEEEWRMEEDFFQLRANLNERLIYGNYPELMHHQNRAAKSTHLKEIVRDYLLKDIFEFEGIQYSNRISDLLRLVAYQVGQEISLPELGRQLGMDKKTVERYLHLLTQVFILFRVGGFSKNLRKEVVKSSKWYFFDNGIRNAIIANFNPIELRNDKGQLWENYIISERIKYLHYHQIPCNYFFWRTYDQQEVDWVEERGGNLFAYEMKWNAQKRVKIPVAWKNAYPSSKFEVINPENYLSWVSLFSE